MRVRALCRSAERAARLLGQREGLEIALGDVRQPSTLRPAFQHVQAVACTMGTTAFPTLRWMGNNTPDAVNNVGTRALIDAALSSCPAARFVLVGSAGVERTDRIPYSILNAGGVLTAMGAAEAALRGSGLAYTAVRSGRLTDGPYTSYDINTLLKGVAGQRQAVRLAKGDVLDGEASRIAVAGEGEARRVAAAERRVDPWCNGCRAWRCCPQQDSKSLRPWRTRYWPSPCPVATTQS